jgi:hypothetical protein
LDCSPGDRATVESDLSTEAMGGGIPRTGLRSSPSQPGHPERGCAAAPFLDWAPRGSAAAELPVASDQRAQKREPKRGPDPVLYRLPEVLRAKALLIVEGEAKADLLVSWGLTNISLANVACDASKTLGAPQ